MQATQIIPPGIPLFACPSILAIKTQLKNCQHLECDGHRTVFDRVLDLFVSRAPILKMRMMTKLMKMTAKFIIHCCLLFLASWHVSLAHEASISEAPVCMKDAD